MAENYVTNQYSFESRESYEQTKKEAEQIEKVKGIRGGDTKETIMNRLLNKFYEGFEQSLNASTDE